MVRDLEPVGMMRVGCAAGLGATKSQLIGAGKDLVWLRC